MGELFPNQELDEAVAPLCVVCRPLRYVVEVGWPLRSLDRFLEFATAGRLLFLDLAILSAGNSDSFIGCEVRRKFAR